MTTHHLSPLDALSNRYLQAIAAHNPALATDFGIVGYDQYLPDYSPEWYEESYNLARTTAQELTLIKDIDQIDAASRDVLNESLQQSINLYEAGLSMAPLGVIASPVQNIIDQFDLLNTDKAEGREAFLARLHAIPQSLQGYALSLEKRVSDNLYPLRILQVNELLKQIEKQADIIASHRGKFTHDEKKLTQFDRELNIAASAYAELSTHIKQLANHAIAENAVGSEAYTMFSRDFLGATIDQAQTYAWGQELVAQIAAEQDKLAQQIMPGEDFTQVKERLDADPQYLLPSRSALQRWMQTTSDAAIADLDGTHFDIPVEIRSLECLIAATGTGGIYYTPPTEDLSRPGQMWWSVPDGVNTFLSWEERTTVYHEGVPGHHLQLGTAMISPQLNQFRKLASFISGHGEGWALYAERLMDELGFLPTIGDRLGMLDSQRFRAARVVIDIGYHCQLPAPASVGGGEWDYAKAWQYLRTQVGTRNEKMLRFELHRYLGWPGQAPSYAIGQQFWLDLREEYLKLNPTKNLRDFHKKALDLGGIGLEALRKHVLS